MFNSYNDTLINTFFLATQFETAYFPYFPSYLFLLLVFPFIFYFSFIHIRFSNDYSVSVSLLFSPYSILLLLFLFFSHSSFHILVSDSFIASFFPYSSFLHTRFSNVYSFFFLLLFLSSKVFTPISTSFLILPLFFPSQSFFLVQFLLSFFSLSLSSICLSSASLLHLLFSCFSLTTHFAETDAAVRGRHGSCLPRRPLYDES